MGRNVTAERFGESVRISLPAAAWTGNHAYGTGITLQAIYLSPHATPPRIITQTYSVWDDGTGRNRGMAYQLHEVGDPDYASILALCDRLDIGIPATLETARDL